MKKIWVFLLIFTAIKARFADDNDIEQVKIGNLTLPSSQQMGPLFSIGQNIVDKNDLQIFSYFDFLKADGQHINQILPCFLYGITDDFSIYVDFPFFPKNKSFNKNKVRLGNIFAQFEYAFYKNTQLESTSQCTVISTFTFDTGLTSKNPLLSFEAPDLLLAGTCSHLDTDLFYFISGGALFNLKRKKNIPNSYYYQGGIGKNISYKPEEWIFSWLVEFDGIVSRDNIDNSTEHIFTIGPSLWFSSKKWVIQFGIGFPLFQKWQDQDTEYFIGLDIGYTF